MAKMKILLVDDEQEFSLTLAERLEIRGYEVKTAVNGEESLQFLEKSLPQIVVLDLKMPGMDGIEV